jgi:DNA invertase Pin-like site-specific DNA recombinase
MIKAAIYARISEDRNGGRLGVDRQEADCRELAARLGWNVTAVYVDNDISAFTGKKRPDYTSLRNAMVNGTITHVISWHTDRLHRTPRELEDYIDASEVNGTVTHTVKAGLVDLSTPGGAAMARTLCAWARYESDIKRERTKAWAKQRAEHGKAPGGIRPFGWSSDRINLDPVEHAIITDIAKRLIAGESLRSVVADLNRRRIPTVTWHPPLTFKTWSPTVVRSMMLRARLAGWRTHNGQIVARGEWQPALEQDTWEQLQAVLADPGRQSGGTGGRVNLLTGLALCGHCDQPVTIQYGGPKRPVNSRNAYGCKACGVWRAQPAVDDYVKGATIAVLEKMEHEPDPGIDPAVTARIVMLRSRIELAGQEFADDDTIGADQYRSIVRRLKERLAVEQQKLRPSRRNILVGKTGADAATAWAGWSLDVRRAVVDAVFEIRILRAGKGRRVFRPETVQLSLR